MALRPDYSSSRQAQHDLDVSLIREIRSDKTFLPKWYVASEVHVGELAVSISKIKRQIGTLFSRAFNFLWLNHSG
jgi:hypothetical protein